MPTRSARMLALLTILVPTARADEAAFRERVAPILEARCVSCHGGRTIKGGLSLATAEGLRRGGDGGPAVVPGKPDESLLVEMIAGDAPEMPKSGGPLKAEQVAAVRSWIADGAPWPEGLTLAGARGPLWSLAPLERPEVPAVSARDRVRTPVDAFMLRALEARGLTFRPEADRRTLIRRLTYDLLGLPPTPEEVDDFVDDPGPDAYERLVDRLLASPRHGERWGRHWLDVVHYGDTHGYDKDKRRDHAWPYRDYVIRSLNEDTPYARFAREQVAGDVLLPDDPRGVTATGFLAAGPWDFVGHVELREGTVEKEKTRVLDRDDMLASTMSTFVSLTVHCARCHDHKFDPIPQADYYRLQAVFAGVDRGDRTVEGADRRVRRQALEARRREVAGRRAALEKAIAGRTSPELARLDTAIVGLKARLGGLRPAAPTRLSPTNGYHSAISPKADATAWVQVDLGTSVPIDEIRLVPARPVDFPDTPGFGFPPRFRVEVADGPDLDRPEVVADESRADLPNPGDHPYVIRLPHRPARVVRVTATRLWERTGDFVFALGELEVLADGKDVALGATVSARDSIEAGLWSGKNLVDGFDSRAALPDPADPASAEVRDLQWGLHRARADRRALADALIDPSTRGELDATAAELAAIDARLKALPPPELVYAVLPHAPRPIRVLNRGDVERPGEPVGPGAPACVPGLEAVFAGAEDEGARRAALADWIADRRNVLTWRSIINRAWHYHFGRGLVDTPNDFGRNGSAPTHPELLDWLAVEFRDGGQSLKALHRLMVTSAAYRQSSAHDEAAAGVDADNRLLWRMNRRRLEAEAIRDAVLAVSGRLDPRMGGPGFALFRFKDDHSPVYDHDAPEAIDPPEGRRRTVYRFVVRSVPNPFVECLDGADPNANVPVRNTTITALQALTLLNDPFLLAEAEAFAGRLAGQGGDLDRRVERAYRLALGRPPRDEERGAVAAYARRHGLAAACRLLFNTNEFIFVD